MEASAMEKTLRRIKRVFIAIIGFTVLLAGIAMMVLPGPAILVIPLGLAILATEFIWARKLLKRIKDKWSKPKGPSGKEESQGSV
jgi:uncharacterized protein (TIGR02611 family)